MTSAGVDACCRGRIRPGWLVPLEAVAAELRSCGILSRIALPGGLTSVRHVAFGWHADIVIQQC